MARSPAHAMAWLAGDRDLPRGVWLPLLAAIVLFAAYLRFTGLDWGCGIRSTQTRRPMCPTS